MNYCAPTSGYTNLRFTQHDIGSGYNPTIPLIVKTILLEPNLSLKRLRYIFLKTEVFLENFNFSFKTPEIVRYCLSLWTVYFFNLLFGANKLELPNNYCFVTTFLQETKILVLFSDGTLLLLIFVKNWRMSCSYNDWNCYFEFKQKRKQNISKKCNFSSPKSVESKEANFLVDKTFSFVNMNQWFAFQCQLALNLSLKLQKSLFQLMITFWFFKR